LGTLFNRVTTSDQAPAWTYGIRALMQDLAKRSSH
jgi:fumarylacetoacetate (FAA) hydrolase family protein